MVGDGVRDGGRQLLLAEELALLAIGEGGGRFPGGAVLQAALGAAILMELRARAQVELRHGAVCLVDGWPTGDPVLDEVSDDLRSAGPRLVRQAIVAIGRTGMAGTIAERLERRGIIVRTLSTILGVIPVRGYRVVPPRMLGHWAIRIHAIVRGEESPDAREHALLPLLAAVHLLPHLVGRADRPAAAAVARALAQGDPILEALHRQIALVEAGDAAALVAVTA